MERRHEERARERGDAAWRRFMLLRLRFHVGLPIGEIAKRWNEEACRLHDQYRQARKEFREALMEVVAFHHPGPREEVEAAAERLLAGAERQKVPARHHGPLDRLGRRDRQRAACEEALAISREIGDRQGEAAAALLDEALGASREAGASQVLALAAAHRALLPGGDPEGALAAFREQGEQLNHGDKTKARFLLFQATRDPTHLAEAKRLLDFAVEHAPENCRESMLANVRLHREIMAAVRETGL